MSMLAIALFAAATGTAEPATAAARPQTPVAPQSVAAIAERNTGGRIRTLYRTTRKIYFVNAQSRLPKDVIEAARLKLETALRTPIDFTDGMFAFPAPKIEGELSLYIIDDANLPMSLVAPEGRWGFVNVAPLAKGRGEKAAFFEARARKEIARIGCMVFGGISSTYRQNLLSFMGSPEALDQHESDNLPVDGPMRCQRYLLSLGVKPYRLTTYKKACEEGWAPAPTNDVQKAIWAKTLDEKECGPTNPITIPPPKKK